jgi:hypothetical protein
METYSKVHDSSIRERKRQNDGEENKEIITQKTVKEEELIERELTEKEKSE